MYSAMFCDIAFFDIRIFLSHSSIAFSLSLSLSLSLYLSLSTCVCVCVCIFGRKVESNNQDRLVFPVYLITVTTGRVANCHVATYCVPSNNSVRYFSKTRSYKSQCFLSSVNNEASRPSSSLA